MKLYYLDYNIVWQGTEYTRDYYVEAESIDEAIEKLKWINENPFNIRVFRLVRG